MGGRWYLRARSSHLVRTIHRVERMFEELKRSCLEANDFDLHYAALVVFNELTTRRLGGKMSFDASGNALVVVGSPIRKTAAPRVKTPKKIAETATATTASKQQIVNDMFLSDGPGLNGMFFGDGPGLSLGAEVDLEAGDVVHVHATAPPADSQESYHSVSPEPSSDPRPIPLVTPVKKGGKSKSRE